MRNIPSMLLLLMMILAVVLTSCQEKNSSDHVITLQKIKNNMADEGLSATPIAIPSQLYSSAAQNQEGYRVEPNGDILYIYEYANSSSLEKDKIKIHNQLNGLEPNTNPMEITTHNMFIIYLKKNKNEYEVENKILKIME